MRILFVCAANICRSPMAERLARRLGLDASSAGVFARDGDPMPAEALRTLEELGADGSGHRSRRLTADLIRDADLVLAMERGQRGAVVTTVPGALRRAFTLREFARLAEHTGTGLVQEIASARGRVPAVPEGEDDIADPYGGSLADYRRCADLIGARLSVVSEFLAEPGSSNRTQRPWAQPYG